MGTTSKCTGSARTVGLKETIDLDAASSLTGQGVFCSWSGGKDAYLAMHRALRAGARPQALLSMFDDEGKRSRGHRLPVALLEQQAAALGLPLVTRATSWDDYEANFIAALRELRERGVEAGVFGDIDLEPHREWVERVCEVAGLGCHLPLWKEPRRTLIDELLDLGVRATVVAVRSDKLDGRFLGREVSQELVGELEAEGVDACGEEGEYHTLVTHGPLFAHAIPLAWDGETLLDGGRFLNITTGGTES